MPLYNEQHTKQYYPVYRHIKDGATRESEALGNG
jgi:hypothetical protein